jgi:hypothetical protein
MMMMMSRFAGEECMRCSREAAGKRAQNMQAHAGNACLQGTYTAAGGGSLTRFYNLKL